jgi:hypothetical protein
MLRYSYRLEGDARWSTPGAPREFTPAELEGRGLIVSVSDEAGRSAQASYALTQGPADLALAAGVSGCATSPRATAWSLLPLCALALVLRRRRRASNP